MLSQHNRAWVRPAGSKVRAPGCPSSSDPQLAPPASRPAWEGAVHRPQHRTCRSVSEGESRQSNIAGGVSPAAGLAVWRLLLREKRSGSPLSPSAFQQGTKQEAGFHRRVLFLFLRSSLPAPAVPARPSWSLPARAPTDERQPGVSWTRVWGSEIRAAHLTFLPSHPLFPGKA